MNPSNLRLGSRYSSFFLPLAFFFFFEIDKAIPASITPKHYRRISAFLTTIKDCQQEKKKLQKYFNKVVPYRSLFYEQVLRHGLVWKMCDSSKGHCSVLNQSKGNSVEYNKFTGNVDSLERLCSISLQACRLMTPLISAIYRDLCSLTNDNDGSSNVELDHLKKVKLDSSAFTIADGLVQRLLIDVLFSQVSFCDIVGEEDQKIDNPSWNQVQGLKIPHHIQSLLESTKLSIYSLSSNLSTDAYQKITVFIDPIDGTHEFSTGKGEQCSICIGFANEYGRAVAGLIYRPLSRPSPTWVAGGKSESYTEWNFAEPCAFIEKGLLTTNGSISRFVSSLVDELQMNRIKAGGAGNKIMMLLENSIQCINECKDQDEYANGYGMLYIQDRGLSRWDTCAAEAILNAFGGSLLKLTEFISDDMQPEIPVEDLEARGRYNYLASESNLDFIPGISSLTKYNSVNNHVHTPNNIATDVHQVKRYSNLCGLVAFGKEWNTEAGRRFIFKSIREAAKSHQPSFD